MKKIQLTILCLYSLAEVFSQNQGCVTPDNIPPVITAVSGNINLVLGPTGNRTVTLADIATITDNCNPAAPYTLNNTNFNCSHRGTQTITVTATDGVFGSPITPGNVKFLNIGEIKFDLAGNLFIADIQNNRIRKLAPNGDVTTLAGNGTSGFADGAGTNATFNQPTHFTIDNVGNIFLTDAINNRIRKITPAGIVTTYAGSTQGNTNGSLSVAKFNSPRGLVFDNQGNLFVADLINAVIRKITPAGIVSTFAGNGTYTTVDGTGTNAGINGPYGLTIDASNNLYVTELYGHTIRKITAAGVVTTLAGNGNSGLANGPALTAEFRSPKSLVFDQAGNLFIADDNLYVLRKIRTDGIVESINTATDWINNGITINAAGLIYYAGISNQVKRILANGSIQTIAGNSSAGFQDGNVGAVAYGNESSLQINVNITQAPPVFTSPQQPEITITIGANCTAPIPDFKSNATATSGCGTVTLTQSPTQGVPAPLGRRPVTIIATDIYGMQSYQTSYIDIVDGTAPVITAISNNIILPLDANGTRTISLADVATVVDNCNNNPLVTISPTTFNCSTTGQQIVTVTTTDGTFGGPLTPGAASFSNPFGLEFDAAGNLYIADQRNNKIRKISASGTVSSVAGNGTEGFANGTGTAAMFDDPRGIAIDGSGNVYTSDIDNHKIRKITPAGVVTTYAGSTQGYSNGNATTAQFSSPRGLAFDAQGNLYVADAYNARIRKITPAGVVTTVAGNGNYSSVDGPVATASIYDPVDVAVDASGNIYVSEASGNKIRKISTSGMVSTMAGDGTYGYNDGAASSAKFAGPQALTVDNTGNIYVADFGNNRIRKISSSNVVSTIAISGYPSGITFGPNGNLYMTDFGNYIKMITLSGVVTTVAGTNNPGSQDGIVGVFPSGNQTTLQIPVTITGQSTPVFSSPQSNVSVTGTGNGCSAILANYATAAVASSSCGGAVTISQSPAAGTLLTLGANTITLTATDASNNTATQIFTVTVVKITPPLITPLSNNVVISLNANGTKTINPSDVATVTNCGHSPLAIVSPSSFTCADIGTRTVTVTATDGTFGTSAPGAVQFYEPIATAVDPSGNIFVADRGNFKIRKISPAGVVSTFADGFSNAQGSDGRFSVLADMASDNNGNIYLADAVGNKVKKITPGGAVSTFAGNGSSGMIDGNGTAASFVALNAITVSSQGIVYVADNNVIRRISPSGDVTTLAGSTTGFADGNGNAAKFWGISGLATDAAGNIYVADGANYRVRKVTPTGAVTTIAGSGPNGFVDGPALSAQFGFLHAIVLDSDNNIFVTDSDNDRIRKISASGIVSSFCGGGPVEGADGNAATASFGLMPGMAMDINRNLFIPEVYTHKIRKVDAGGNVTTIAGSGTAGYQDGSIISNGTGNQSSLQIQVTIQDITAPLITPVSNNITIPLNANGSKTITLADVATVTDNCNNNSSVRISPSIFDCSNIGIQTVTVEATDGTFNAGTPATVSFNSPVSITSYNGIIYVADRGTESIRKITPNGDVTLFAGNPASSGGFADGQGTNARFLTVSDLATDAAGNIYIADAGNRRIRKITPGGLVTTIAGNGLISSIDGTGTSASFESPNAITVDGFGNIYVADFSKIRKINSSGVVTTVAGSTAGFADGNGLNAKFWGPSGLTTDAEGNLYIADGANHRVRKMTPSADVTTIAGGAGQFGFLHAIAREAAGIIYVCDADNYMIKQVSATGTITTIAGNGSAGTIDGTGASASFNRIFGMTISDGNLYVTEFNDHKIRKLTTAGVVTTFAGSGNPGIANGNIGGITGNYTSMQIPVTITGQSIPVFTSSQSNVIINANTSCTATIGNYTSTASASALCGGTINITQSPVEGSLLSVGVNNVTLTATNNTGSVTQTFNITVADNTPPLISCPANISTQPNSTHPNQTGWATATDNCTASSNIVISYTDSNNPSQGCSIIRTWKATDASGNFSTCIQTIASSQLSVSLGPNMYILFGALGYTGCRTITPVINGGVGPYAYSWTSTDASLNGATSATISTCKTIEVVHTYTVVVTSANGCSATASVQLNFINISCSNNANNQKVQICHRPEGNPQNCNTICVSANAVEALINSGSYYGKCLPNCEIPVQSFVNAGLADLVKPAEILKLHSVVNPNPHQGSFRIKIISPEAGMARIELFTVNGQKISGKSVFVRKADDNIVLYKGLKQGTIFYRVQVGKHSSVGKIIGMD